MKTLIKLQRNAQRILATIALFTVLGISANAQTRSYTLSVLQKTDYVINEACDITDYFYFNDGEFIAKALYFQDYAYHLYDSRRYLQAVQYSLKARSYAINAIEICDDYWHYYDYHYYGYSTMWGNNYSVVIGNTQLHWGLTNAIFHNNMRVNWNLYFTTREWNYYTGLPSEVIFLNGLYNYRGGIVYFNDRYVNVNIYRTMQVRINTGRDIFVKSYPHTVVNMAPKPKDIRPSNAPMPSNTRRATVNEELQYNNNVNRPNNSGNNSSTSDGRRPTANPNINPSNDRSGTNGNTGNNSSTSDGRRPATNANINPSNDRSGTNGNTGNNSSTSDNRRPATTTTNNSTTNNNNAVISTQDNNRRNSQTTTPQVQVNNKSNAAQDKQARQQVRQSSSAQSRTTSSPSSSSSSGSSSTSSTRRR